MNHPTAERFLRRSALALMVAASVAALTACGSDGASKAPAAAPTPAVEVAPVITTQPQAQSAAPDATATFSVAVAGTGPVTYQWSRNTVPIAGATAASYTTPVVALNHSADVLRVSVTNAKGTTNSDGAVLLVSGIGRRTLAGRAPEVILSVVDGLGKEARLQQPGAMAVDAAGNLLVVEPSRRAIRKVTPSGLVTSWISGKEGGEGLNTPRHIAVANGNVYVTDGATADMATALRKIDPAGVVSTIALAPAPGDPVPTSIPGIDYTALAADAAGNVYLASVISRIGPDECSSCDVRISVRKIAPDGKITILLSSHTGPKGGDPITALAVDKAGNVFALDAKQLRRIGADGVVTVVMANGENYVNAIAVDAAGNLYFTTRQFSGRPTTWQSRGLGKVTLDGKVEVVADPDKDARFASVAVLDSPEGIAIDAAGAIYVSMFDSVKKLVLP